MRREPVERDAQHDLGRPRRPGPFALDEFEPSAKAVHLINLTYKTGPNTTLGDVRQVFRVVTDLPGEVPLEISATLRVDP